MNEFVNVAVTKELAYYEHLEWVERRKPITEERIARALGILNRAGSAPPEPHDELLQGYERAANLP